MNKVLSNHNPLDLFTRYRIIELKTSSTKNFNTLIGGIDEAGRGPVIGPLIIALVVFRDTYAEFLRDLGVKDSKLLTPQKRLFLFKAILDLSKTVLVAILPPNIIDRWVSKNLLNRLEAKVISELISRLPPKFRIYIDAPSSPKSFLSYLYEFLPRHYHQKLIVENKADKKYIVVSAASIIAKVIRDMQIKRIKNILGLDFGSGYPSDPKTKDSLGTILKIAPKIVRKTWLPVKKILNKTLLDYF